MAEGEQKGWSSWDQIKTLQDFSAKIWQMYISWFTWSLGANLLAMSYLAAKSDINKTLVLGLGTVMIITITLSIGVCYIMRRYFYSTIVYAQSLAKQGTVDIGLLFGEPVARYVHLAIGITFTVLAAAWVLFVVFFGIMPNSGNVGTLLAG